MTSLKIKDSNPLFDHYHFVDTGFSCKIFPALGASIQELKIKDIQIIEGVSLDEQGLKAYREKYNSAILFPFPNRIENGKYQFLDKNYQLTLNESSGKNAIHGLVSSVRFEEVAFSHHSVSLKYLHKSSPGYPFPFELIVKYQFSKQRLILTFEVINTGLTEMPFGMGWHPYFLTEKLDETVLEFQPDLELVNDRNLIPKKTKQISTQQIRFNDSKFDQAYHLSGNEVKFRTKSYSFCMTLDNGNYLQIYTPQSGTSVAIEPMTCPGNSFNNHFGLRTLQPQENFSWSIKTDFDFS